MKRKSRYIPSYVEKIDTRFDPVDGCRPLEIITSASAIGEEFKHYLVSGSQVRFLRYEFGIIFSQKVIVRRQVFWLHVFRLNKPVKLLSVTNDLLLSLNYMLKGGLGWCMNGEKRTLREGRYQLYALAKNISCDLHFNPGLSVAFHFTVPGYAVPDLINVYNDNTNFEKVFTSNSEGIHSPGILKISSAAKKHIIKILSLKTAVSVKEEFARAASWTEHLAALFSRYVADRNRADVGREWELANKLQVTNLPKYIEEHLFFEGEADLNPLGITNVIRKTKLRKRAFHLALQQEFGCTWRELLNRVRMAKAAEILVKQPSLSIADIASALGYSYPTHFSRAFKLYKGRSPAQYRNLEVNDRSGI